MVKRRIVWDDPAKIYLKKSLEFIRRDSPQNADKIRNEIRIIIKEIPAHPERYPADKYRLNNDGAYRALEIYSYRISYYIGDNEIRIVRIKHTSQEPLNY